MPDKEKRRPPRRRPPYLPRARRRGDRAKRPIWFGRFYQPYPSGHRPFSASKPDRRIHANDMATIGQSEEVNCEARTDAAQTADVGPNSTTKMVAVKCCHADRRPHGNSPGLPGGRWRIQDGSLGDVASACTRISASANSNAKRREALENQAIGNMVIERRAKEGEVVLSRAVVIESARNRYPCSPRVKCKAHSVLG